MNRFFATPYFINYLRRLAKGQPDNDHLNDVVTAQDFLKKASQQMKSILNEHCQRVLAFYCANWRIKPTSMNTFHKGESQVRHSLVTQENGYVHQQILTSKESVQHYLRAFIRLYSEELDGIEDGYRQTLLKYLKRLKKAVDDYTFCKLENEYVQYHYVVEVSNDGIKLILGSTSPGEIESKMDDGWSYTSEAELLKIDSEFVTIDQFAALYEVSPQTVRRWISEVKLHKAIRINGTWLIPELQPRPTKGRYSVDYFWSALPKQITRKFPYLKNARDARISKHMGENLFTCLSMEGIYRETRISNKERINLERHLLIYADDVQDNRAILVPG